jgi:hypothetical protein
MTSRAKRLTFIVTVAALAAVIVGGILAPEPAAAAKKDKPTNEFTIKAGLFWYAGDFTATGAIADSGLAWGGGTALSLDGALGTINIDLHDDGTFTIAGGTVAYEGLKGAGTYTVKSKWIVDKKKPMDDPIWLHDYTLNGTTL